MPGNDPTQEGPLARGEDKAPSQQMTEKLWNGSLPKRELHIEGVLSSGPGGQNGDKDKTKAQLRWKVWESNALSSGEKARFIEYVKKNRGSLLVGQDEILMTNSVTRSYERNKDNVTENLENLISKALEEKKIRIPTEVPEGVKARRVDDKRKLSEKKSQRRDSGCPD